LLCVRQSPRTLCQSPQDPEIPSTKSEGNLDWAVEIISTTTELRDRSGLFDGDRRKSRLSFLNISQPPNEFDKAWKENIDRASISKVRSIRRRSREILTRNILHPQTEQPTSNAREQRSSFPKHLNIPQPINQLANMLNRARPHYQLDMFKKCSGTSLQQLNLSSTSLQKTSIESLQHSQQLTLCSSKVREARTVQYSSITSSNIHQIFDAKV